MTPGEYEVYVEALVRQMSFGPRAAVARNKRYPGVRQRGLYEIDVAVEIDFDSKLRLLVIIECKNRGRPVDRPIVQNLVQTRDAIGAHKGVIASPKGFSQEAVDVARDHGVALWVLSEAVWTTVNGLSANPRRRQAYQHRKDLIHRLGFQFDAAPAPTAFVSVTAVQQAQGEVFQHACLRGSGAGEGSNEPGVDARLASSEVVDCCVELLQVNAARFDAQELF